MRIIHLVLFLLTACSTLPKTKYNVVGDTTTRSGWTSVIQTFTSDTETSINILRPHLNSMAYFVEADNGNLSLDRWDPKTEQKIIKTTSGPQVHWKVDRIHIKNLKPNQKYRLLIVNKFRKRAVDTRRFKTLDINKSTARFIVGSCMSDSHAFEHVRAKIWDRMLTHQADFMMLLGDQVYVDDFAFVKRQKATEFDIWTRYIDSLRKTPIFQNRELIPILSVWDDHDFGTNNSDKNFKSKKAAFKIYEALFGGEPISNVVEKTKEGVYFSFSGFKQNFLFMDDRYFREPSQKAPYGQWGKKQHQWFTKKLKKSKAPLWLANGGQFFTEATFKTRKNGSKKQLNETFVYDHPKHFQKLLGDIKAAQVPVMFLSGDIHYSEIVGIEKSMLGYETYEITSSPIHSYIFRSKKGPETWLKNPRRLVSVKEHNYVLVESHRYEKGVKLKVESFGVKQEAPFFTKTLMVER